jgi:hypothetical protein
VLLSLVLPERLVVPKFRSTAIRRAAVALVLVLIMMATPGSDCSWHFQLTGLTGVGVSLQSEQGISRN